MKIEMSMNDGIGEQHNMQCHMLTPNKSTGPSQVHRCNDMPATNNASVEGRARW